MDVPPPPGSARPACPKCGSFTQKHCKSESCPWFKCPRPMCRMYGGRNGHWAEMPAPRHLSEDDRPTKDET